MRITQRQSTLGTLFVLLALISLACVSQILRGDFSMIFTISVVALVIISLLTVAYWRGWGHARHAIVIFLTVVVVGIVNPGEQFVSVVALMPPILALVLTGPDWVIGSGIGVYLGGLGVGGVSSAYADPLYALAFLISVMSLVVGRMVLDTVLQESRDNAHRVEQALAVSEQQALDMNRQAQLLSEQNEQQRRLLDLVAVLETPAVTLADGIVLAPIMGVLDSRRIMALTSRLLEVVARERTNLVLLDISGVPMIDTGVAQALMHAAQSLRLLGCDVTLTGISANVAATITQMGIAFDGIQTVRSPQEALAIRTLIRQ